MTALFAHALRALAADQVDAKLEAVDQLELALADGAAVPASLASFRPEAGPFDGRRAVLYEIPVSPAPTFASLVRGVPARPPLVLPQDVPQRKPTTVAGRAALLHAITHIEFTAIDLALDHALRFPDLPADYYGDWLGVAVEEARHFRLLRERLRALGHDYGDFPAHDSLWRMAERSAHDALVRMALVPRLLEARGLDATPPIQRKLEDIGDEASARALDVILHDEVGHVGLGDRWYRFLCRERGIEPESHFRQLIAEYGAPWPLAPMNREARRQAGFGAGELDGLTQRGVPG